MPILLTHFYIIFILYLPFPLPFLFFSVRYFTGAFPLSVYTGLFSLSLLILLHFLLVDFFPSFSFPPPPPPFPSRLPLCFPHPAPFAPADQFSPLPHLPLYLPLFPPLLSFYPSCRLLQLCCLTHVSRPFVTPFPLFFFPFTSSL